MRARIIVVRRGEVFELDMAGTTGDEA